MIARTAYNTRELEESLAARGIPYTVEGGSSFFSRPEVQAPLALLALCANPQARADVTVVFILSILTNTRLCCVHRPRRGTDRSVPLWTCLACTCRKGSQGRLNQLVLLMHTSRPQGGKASICCRGLSLWYPLPVSLAVSLLPSPVFVGVPQDDAAFRQLVSLRSRTRLLDWATPAAMRGIGELAVAEGVSYAEGVRLSVSRGHVEEREASTFIYGLRRWD